MEKTGRKESGEEGREKRRGRRGLPQNPFLPTPVVHRNAPEFQKFCPDPSLGVTLGSWKWYNWLLRQDFLLVFNSDYRPRTHRLATVYKKKPAINSNQSTTSRQRLSQSAIIVRRIKTDRFLVRIVIWAFCSTPSCQCARRTSTSAVVNVDLYSASSRTRI